MAAEIPRTSFGGSPVSEKSSSRKPAEQARLHTPRYRIGMRAYEYEFPRMSPLGSSVTLLHADNFLDFAYLGCAVILLSGVYPSVCGVILGKPSGLPWRRSNQSLGSSGGRIDGYSKEPRPTVHGLVARSPNRAKERPPCAAGR